MVKKHFVRFYSPGSFVAEISEKPIASWDIEKAREMAAGVKERHNATPYAFSFVTRSRTEKHLDSSITAESGLYYLGGKIRTLAEVEAQEPNSILASNMRMNKYERVVESTSGWSWARPLEPEDVVLEMEHAATT